MTSEEVLALALATQWGYLSPAILRNAAEQVAIALRDLGYEIRPISRCNCPESGTSGSCPFHDSHTYQEAR